MTSQCHPMALKRIHREIADIAKEDLGNIVLAPSEDDLFLWKAMIPGPEGSCYEGGVFNVDVNLAHDYPFSAPKVTFTTRIYHMNISDKGNVCIDILKQNWSPALSLFKVMLSLSSLLTDPNPKDPLVPSIATEYVRNRLKHDQTARMWTEMYARPKPPRPQATTSATSKQKGKRKDSRPSRHSSAAVSTSVPGDPITIDDSDSERTSVRSRRSTRSRGGKRKREESAVDIDLTIADRNNHGAESSHPVSRTTGRDSGIIEIVDTGPSVLISAHQPKRPSRKSRRTAEVITIDD